MITSSPQLLSRAACINLVADAMRSGHSKQFAPTGLRHKVDVAVYRAAKNGELPNAKHYMREQFLRWAVTKWPTIQAQFPTIRPLPNIVKCVVSINIVPTIKAEAVTIPADHEVLRQRYVALQLHHQEEVRRLQQIVAEQGPKARTYDDQQAGNRGRLLKSKVRAAPK
jgi:hypothetical protein